MASRECLICVSSFDPSQHLYSYGVCGHSDVCSLCFMRMRAVQRNMTCPTCKTTLEYVVCSPLAGKNYEQFNVWGDNCGPNHQLDSRSQMFFPKEYFKNEVEPLWATKCKICSASKRDMKALRTHVHGEHNLQICQLCLDNRNSFPREHKYYTQAEYETHLRSGDGDGSEGHPFCEFCRKRYFDRTALFTHLSKDHYNCHICTKAGIQYKYYASYLTLENHFRAEHFLCEERSCLEKRFTVFSNTIDLAAHTLQYHPASQISRHIPVHFKVKKSSRSGGGGGGGGGEEDREGSEAVAAGGVEVETSGSTGRFEGGLGGRALGGEWQIELAYQAQDPRNATRTAGVGAVDWTPAMLPESSEEAFPALQGEGRSNSQTVASWVKSRSGGNSSRGENYPGLPSSGKGGSRGKTSVVSDSSMSLAMRLHLGEDNPPLPSSSLSGKSSSSKSRSGKSSASGWGGAGAGTSTRGAGFTVMAAKNRVVDRTAATGAAAIPTDSLKPIGRLQRDQEPEDYLSTRSSKEPSSNITVGVGGGVWPGRDDDLDTALAMSLSLSMSESVPAPVVEPPPSLADDNYPALGGKKSKSVKTGVTGGAVSVKDRDRDREGGERIRHSGKTSSSSSSSSGSGILGGASWAAPSVGGASETTANLQSHLESSLSAPPPASQAVLPLPSPPPPPPLEPADFPGLPGKASSTRGSSGKVSVVAVVAPSGAKPVGIPKKKSKQSLSADLKTILNQTH